MPKTKKVYRVRVYFSKDEYMEWKDIEDVGWPDENTVEFTTQNDEVISINAPAQLMVVTEKEEIVA